MISEIANVQGNAVPPGRLTGQWRQSSKLEWPALPKPPPNAWEIFRKMMMKAFGTMARVYNPGAEVPFQQKLGPWLKLDSHVQYTVMHDEDTCFVHKDGAWIRYKWNSKEKVNENEGKASVDIRECHPVKGQIEDQVVFTHFKYNMEKDQMQNGHERLEETVINEVEPQET